MRWAILCFCEAAARSHVFLQALMLEYESALTRKLVIPAFARTLDGEKEGYYCTSA